ncbi:MAG: zf-TFIIB domain-containing protein [Nitrososphaeraceae archaeon]
MQCPNCSNTMQEKKRFDVDIDYCPVCKGVWLDKGEMNKIAKAQSGYEEEHYQNYHKDRKDYDYHEDDDGDYHKRRRKRGFLGDLFDFD